MTENSILVISNETKRVIKNSIRLCITLTDNIHGLNIVNHIDGFIEKILQENTSIEWVIYDLELNNNNAEDMIIFNSYLPHYIYNKYTNQKFIFTSSGVVFGETNWDKTEIDSHNPKTLYAKTRSSGEIEGARAWLLRYDLFDDKFLEQSLLDEKVYYGSIDNKHSYITNKALNSIIEGLINNYKEFNSSTYHIIPKDNQTEYELLNYLSWKRKNNSYIERSSSVFPSNKVLKTSKLNLLNHLWSFAGYEEIPTFKDLFDEIS
jgi:dTDP-4-dehydrorhamnose reductase